MEANHLLIINTQQILMLKLEQIHILFIFNNVMLIWRERTLLFITCLFHMLAFCFALWKHLRRLLIFLDTVIIRISDGQLEFCHHTLLGPDLGPIRGQPIGMPPFTLNNVNMVNTKHKAKTTAKIN